MNDLKNQDPAAFSIVQALLAKQKLGLLDPTHPSASFTAATAPVKHKSFQEEAEAAGITKDDSSVVNSMSEMSMQSWSSKSSVPYPDAGSSSPYPQVSSSSHDPWHFHSSADDDDKLVQGVLGQVADLKGQQPESTDSSSSSLSLTGVASQMMDDMNSKTHRRSYVPAEVAPAPEVPVHYEAPPAIQAPVPQPEAPVPEMSALSTQRSMSYPTEASSAQPYPEAGMHHDPWHYSQVDDDKLVQGVLGGDVASDSSSMSLSAMASSMVGSGSTGSLTSDAAALGSVFDKRTPSEPEQNFDSSSLASDRIVPVRVAPIPREEPEAPASPDASLANSYATLYGATREAPKPAQSLGQQNSYLTGIDFSSELKAAAAEKAAPQPPAPRPSMAANQANSYLKGINLRSTADDTEDFSTRAVKELSMSSLHRFASTFRAEQQSQAGMSSQMNMLNLGNGYAQALAKARGEKWKRSLAATNWGGAGRQDPQALKDTARAATNAYLSDLN